MTELPFNHPVNVRTLPKRGRDESFTADEAQCAAIAADQDLIAVKSFRAIAQLTPWNRDGIAIAGRVVATVVQPCAVTGDPLTAEIDEDFEATTVPEGSRMSKPRTDPDGELLLDPEGEDPPDTFTGDTLDLAQVWLEHLALAIDPFARIEGAELPAADTSDDASPFAALAKLKRD